jgi:beta-phosphoglucomutase-like phosphatase (HAD superfamily)
LLHAILLAVLPQLDPALAFIFDMDGVLVHSMPLHTSSWERYLASLGVHIENLEARMHGKRNPELVRDFFGSDLSEEDVLKHGAAKEKLWREMAVEAGVDNLVVRGLREFLARYPDVPKAVGSNAERANVDFVLEEFNLKDQFRAVIDGFQVERPKPFPDIYLKAAQILERDPRNCIVFEDSPTGLEAGRLAGMRLVAVETTPTRFENYNLLIRDFADSGLDDWLMSQRPV